MTFFSRKDLRRAEALVVRWFKTFKEDNVQAFIEPNFPETGVLGPMMPSIRAMLCRAFDRMHTRGDYKSMDASNFEALLPELDPDIDVLCKIVLPVGTRFQALKEDAVFQELRVVASKKSGEEVEGHGVIEAGNWKICSQGFPSLFESLSPRAKQFLEKSPFSDSTEIRTKVTESLVGWMYYMEQIFAKKAELSASLYFDGKQIKGMQANAEWNTKMMKAEIWAKFNVPSHAAIIEEYEVLVVVVVVVVSR